MFLQLFVTEQQEFEKIVPQSGFPGHYVYPNLDIQGIFWISIVENFVDIVKNSGIPGLSPRDAGARALL